jgi:serine beta-lactamase-like protein LACTB, mitochondrial
MRGLERSKPGLRRFAAWVWIAALGACPAVFAADTRSGLPPAKVHEIRRVVLSEMSRWKIPGLTVAIGEDLRLAWSEGFGSADVEGGVSATSATVYRIASVSKPITAVAAMQLVERGKLDLDAPIQQYVPAFPQKPWPITARELLSHLSGIRHYNSLREVDSTRHYTDLLAPLKIFADEPLVFEPGTHFLYSTYGYSLLGAAVEAASAKTFVDCLRSNIFTPAHMNCTRMDDVYSVIAHRARGYRRTVEGEIENCALADDSNKIPGGGFVSTAGDLVRFAVALEGGQLANSQSRALMFTPVHTTGGRSVPYGLGWMILDRGSKRWVGHSGAQPGASAYLLVSPSNGFAVAVLANLEGADLLPLSLRIADITLQ